MMRKQTTQHSLCDNNTDILCTNLSVYLVDSILIISRQHFLHFSILQVFSRTCRNRVQCGGSTSPLVWMLQRAADSKEHHSWMRDVGSEDKDHSRWLKISRRSGQASENLGLYITPVPLVPSRRRRRCCCRCCCREHLTTSNIMYRC